jgi:hypothetical protein
MLPRAACAFVAARAVHPLDASWLDVLSPSKRMLGVLCCSSFLRASIAFAAEQKTFDAAQCGLCEF